MSDYRRYFVPGGTFFFTLVTENRVPLFSDESARNLLGDIMRRSQRLRPVEVIAIVLLPDHLHTLWALPPGDDDYSGRWSWIKKRFTSNWLKLGGREQTRTASRMRQRRRGVLQRRFWEHTIRDEQDLENHFDYIHYNPVKHGYVQRPRDWPWSSFHRWASTGYYDIDWGAGYVPPELPGDAGE